VGANSAAVGAAGADSDLRQVEELEALVAVTWYRYEGRVVAGSVVCHDEKQAERAKRLGAKDRAVIGVAVVKVCGKMKPIVEYTKVGTS
jgi:hypothetical protein